jgi:hypothetical protein
MRALALAVAGSALLSSLPAAAQTPPAPPVTVVVVPGGPPAAPPPAYAPPAPYYAPPGPYYAPAPPYYAPPGPYYAPAAPYPLVPARERRSIGGMAAGIVGVSAGGILLISSAFAAMIADASCDSFTGSCSNRSQTTAIALGVSGGLAIAIGIPLLVWGAQKVPVGTAVAGNVPSPLPAWAGAPGGPGWRWRF